jgi:hypothetical protein
MSQSSHNSVAVPTQFCRNPLTILSQSSHNSVAVLSQFCRSPLTILSQLSPHAENYFRSYGYSRQVAVMCRERFSRYKAVEIY